MYVDYNNRRQARLDHIKGRLNILFFLIQLVGLKMYQQLFIEQRAAALFESVV